MRSWASPRPRPPRATARCRTNWLKERGLVTLDALAREVRVRLDALATPAVRRSFERLVPGARILGVRVPALRALAKDLRREAVLDLERACDLMDRLCASRVREEFLVGTFVLVALGKAATAIPWTRLVGWLRAIDNWETCDQLAMGVAAPVLATVADPIAPLTRLARARAPWTRRFAAATAAALCQKGRGLSAPALAVAFELHADADERVQKAVGWAIREASDLDEAAAYRFLKRLRGRMPARVLREAAEKLTPRHRAELVGDRGAAPTPLPTPSRRGTA